MTTIAAIKQAKDVAKSLIRYFVANLPAGGRLAALDRLIEITPSVEALYKLAPKLNVVSLSVRGKYGIISQSIADKAMLPFYIENGYWAAQTNETLTTFFATSGGGAYVDVGANIGLTTIPVAQNPEVQCLALEPEPSNFSYLSTNVAANCPHQNVTMKRLAAYSERRQLRFEISPDNLGDHRIRLNDTPGQLNEQLRRTIEVEAIPLDEIVPHNSDRPLAIKIDVEGAEPFVVAGGRRTLERASLLVMEIWPYSLVRMGGDLEEIISLVQNSFEAIRSRNQESGLFSAPMSGEQAAAHVRQVVQQHNQDPLFYMDIFAVKHGVRLFD